MPLTRDEEREFSFLTRHLKEFDLDSHIAIAKNGWKKIKKNKLDDSTESIVVLKSSAFLDNVSKAAQKYSDNLREIFNIANDRLESCNNISKKLRAWEMKRQGHTIFSSSEISFEQKFKKTFEPFRSAPSFIQKHTKNPKKG